MKNIDELIGRALREEPSRGLPAGFAARIAARAVTGEFSRFETFLMIALVGALVVCGVMNVGRLGSEGMHEVVANGWIAAFLACVAVSWLIGMTAARSGMSAPPPAPQ